ncbi:tunicamycin resistance protein [Clostridium saccharoperbutylacetonicum]|uniref:tunicamycin resistance protein n=1 Tax=Clostridium saccharoperbutylacetonicum TaxID=36745 RepID=UPI0039E8A345
MIVWINGPFGVGKSSTAELLHSKIESSHLYDPEQVGYFLWDNFPKEMKEKGDFQELEIWRSINYQIIKHMDDNYNGIIIIPMTITNIEYYNQIMGRLLEDGVKVYHFILNAYKEEIKHRLISRGEREESWAEQQIDRCLHAFKFNINGEKINTNNLKIEQVVDIIMKRIT